MLTPDMDSAFAQTLLGGSDAILKLANQAANMEKQVAETQVVHAGNAITLPAEPEKMAISTAMAILAARQKAADQLYDIHEAVDGYPLDAAAAFYRAVQNRYGFVNSVTVEKRDMWGRKYDHRPDMRQIRVGPRPDDIIQVPVGAFQLPDFDDPIETQLFSDRRTGKMHFLVTGTLKAKDRAAIKDILADTRRELQENSIYKRRAIILRADEDGDVTLENEPEFMDISKISPSQLILSRETETDLQVNLFAFLTKTKEFRLEGISLKHTAVMDGPYGTGKTLCASVTAKIGTDNGWTYIMVDHPAGLPDALRFARNYQPAIVFAEDVDRVVEDRDDQANRIFDEADGILAKNCEIITVLTTNHLEKIHAGMLRAGRIDAVIYVGAPDAEAAERLVRLYAGKRLDAGEPLATLGREIAGYIPAFIAEIVKRALRSMVWRGDSKLKEEDLLIAARNVQPHVDRVCGKRQDAAEPNHYEKLGRAFSEVMANGPLSAVTEKLDLIHACVD